MQQIQGVSLKKFPNSELEYLSISNQYCDAKIALQGGQILEFYSKVAQRPLLWLSDLNGYQAEKAIRGGIPLCFPWFGAHASQADLPAHGFARNLIWHCDQIEQDDTGHYIHLSLTDSEKTRKYWNYAFNLQMQIHCGKNLELTFKLQNTDEKNFEFGFAWHSYFPAHTMQARIIGLNGLDYIDQLDQNKIKQQAEAEITFDAELDRIYSHTAGQFVLQQGNEQSIRIASSAKSAVIWNPWVDKAKRMADVADEAWRDFICIECGQIASATQSLNAGDSIQFELKIRDES